MKRFFLLGLCLAGFIAATEYGIAAEDDFSAIQNAITASIQKGPGGVVTLEAGKIYRLGSRPEANGAITMIGADGLTLNGNGATLLAHPTCMIFAVAKSRNVTLKNLTIDYDPLPYTQAVIRSISPESGTLIFSPMSGYADPVVSDYGNSLMSGSCFRSPSKRVNRMIVNVRFHYRHKNQKRFARVGRFCPT